MVHVRASAIRARLDWVRTQRGPEHIEPILAALDGGSPAREVDVQRRHEFAIRSAVTPNLWVPFDAYVALNVEIDRRFGTGDLALCRVLGRYTAEVNLPTIYRIFYKIGTPTYILTKVAAVWSSHYDSGSATMRVIPGGCLVSVENFGMPHRCHCNSVLGWMEQTVIITGARFIDARESACRLRGAKACEFQILYDA